MTPQPARLKDIHANTYTRNTHKSTAGLFHRARGLQTRQRLLTNLQSFRNYRTSHQYTGFQATETEQWVGAVVASTLNCAATGTWRYFAFGSNLNRSVLEGRRQVTPLSQRAGYVDDYRLAFNLLGIPGFEPSFASVEPAKGHKVHGAVFELDTEGWIKICQTEAVPFSYVPEPVVVNCYDGGTCEAFTLRAAPLVRAPPWREVAPSRRYARLLVEGAAQRGLSPEWQRELRAMMGEP